MKEYGAQYACRITMSQTWLAQEDDLERRREVRKRIRDAFADNPLGTAVLLLLLGLLLGVPV